MNLADVKKAPVLAGIILAAGASRRMGSPKALLDWNGESFVNRLIRTLSAACGNVIVVLGHHADSIRPTLCGSPGVAVNPDPERGQLSSLQSALALLPENAGGFFFIPVDCPGIQQETVLRLADTFRECAPGTLLVVPREHGRHGHPVCASPSLAREFLDMPPTSQAREVIHRHRSETVYVDVEDPHIHTDIDDREAYLRLAGSAL